MILGTISKGIMAMRTVVSMAVIDERTAVRRIMAMTSANE